MKTVVEVDEREWNALQALVKAAQALSIAPSIPAYNRAEQALNRALELLVQIRTPEQQNP